MTSINALKDQLDRIEADVAAVKADVAAVKSDTHVVRTRVDHVERRASFWGALGGVMTALVTHLGGCL